MLNSNHIVLEREKTKQRQKKFRSCLRQSFPAVCQQQAELQMNDIEQGAIDLINVQEREIRNDDDEINNKGNM